MGKNKDYIYYGLFLSETCKLQIERQIERRIARVINY